MNLKIGRKLFQIVWWGWQRPCGYWRWPPLETREIMEVRMPGKGMSFGFHGLHFGPIEFRYHPNHTGR